MRRRVFTASTALLLFLATACSSVPERRQPVAEPDTAQPLPMAPGSAQSPPAAPGPAQPMPSPTPAPSSPAPAPSGQAQAAPASPPKQSSVDNRAAAAPSPAPARPTLTTIRVFTHGQQPMFETVVPAFHERYGQYRIEVVTPPPSNQLAEESWMRKMVAAGELDLVILWTSTMSFLIKENLLTPLDPFIARTGFDLAPLGPVADLLRFDGRLLDLPVVNTPNVLVYNKALWEKTGLAPPRKGWTWEDLRHAAQKLTGGAGASKIWGLSDYHGTNLPHMYIWQRTGRLPWEADEQTIKETLQLSPR